MMISISRPNEGASSDAKGGAVGLFGACFLAGHHFEVLGGCAPRNLKIILKREDFFS